MPKSPEPEGSPRLMTTAEIAAEHDVSRQTIHTYRRTGIFPAPVEGEGSTRPRFRENEVAAFFKANPKQPRKKRRPQPEQGEPMTTTTVRDRLMETLKSPGLVGLSEEEAAELVDAYRSDVLREAADTVTGLDYFALRADFEYDSQRDAWDGGTMDAATALRRMADGEESSDG